MTTYPCQVIKKAGFSVPAADPSIKIIEFNVQSATIGRALVAVGHYNYLGLAQGYDRLRAVRAEAPEIAQHFQLMPEMNRLSRHNADIVILSGISVQALRECLRTGHVRGVWWQPRNPPEKLMSLLLWLYKRARRRVGPLGFARVRHKEADEIELWMVNRYAVYRSVSARRYIDPRIGLLGFFQQLDTAGVRYVVLRWFEDFPRLALGEDVDLLVHDEDLAKINDVLEGAPGIIPCDVYSVSGYPGSDYDGMAYYPPYLAEAILRKRVRWKDQFYVPSPEHYFLSLAYHVVYHKAEKSGLPTSPGENPSSGEPEHPYSEILVRLADEIGKPIRLNLKDLHETLRQEGWCPAMDTLRRLAQRRPWLSSLIPSRTCDTQDGELMVFVVREWAAARDLTSFTVSWLEEQGLDVLKVRELDKNEQSVVAQRLRGGNWGAGPWPVSGGPPSAVIAAYDYQPTPVPSEKRVEFPNVNNGHFFLKQKLRQEINRSLPFDQRTNPIHSSDDEIEAWEYLEVACPELIAELRKSIERRQIAYRTPERVLGIVGGHATRAKVELIEYKGRRAVKKTFKLGRERFLARERFVHGELGKGHPAIPPLLEYGENYIITPWYRDVLSRVGILREYILRLYARDIIGIMKFFYDEGFAIIDFHPGNTLVSLGRGLLVVDFEHLYQYSERPKSFKDSFDVAGIPSDFDGDFPLGYKPPGITYERHWKPILRAELAELM